MEGIIWLGLFTLAFLILDIYLFFKVTDYFKLKKNGVSCYARIIKLEKRSNRGHISYRPWIEYTTKDNVVITSAFESAMSIKSKRFSVGKSVKIYYDSNNPEKYVIDKNSLYILFELIFIVTIFMACICMLFVKLILDNISSNTHY